MQLEKHKKFLEKITLRDATEEMKFLEEQSLLDEEDLGQAKQFMKALTEAKKSPSNQIESRRYLKVDDMLLLLNNKSNFLSEEASALMETMLRSISRYIESVELSNLHINGMDS